jgi:hypothetical protein
VLRNYLAAMGKFVWGHARARLMIWANDLLAAFIGLEEALDRGTDIHQ